MEQLVLLKDFLRQKDERLYCIIMPFHACGGLDI